MDEKFDKIIDDNIAENQNDDTENDDKEADYRNSIKNFSNDKLLNELLTNNKLDRKNKEYIMNELNEQTLGFKQKEALNSEQQTYYLKSKKYYHNSLGRIKNEKKKKEADESYFNAEKMYRHYVNFKNDQKAHVSYKDLYEWELIKNSDEFLISEIANA